MLILATDTSHRTGVVGLVRGNKADDCRLIAEASCEPVAENLLPALEKLLADNKAALADIDLYAVVTGPGSFTGLRIGLSAIKTLAHLEKKPVVGVSALQAVAATWSKNKTCAVILHSSGEEFYFAVFDAKMRLIVAECLVTRAELTAQLKNISEPVELIGSGVAIFNSSEQKQVTVPAPLSVARLGMDNFTAGVMAVELHTQPNYFRLSEVERRRGVTTQF